MIILSWNSNRIRQKAGEFLEFVKDWKPDVITLQKTRLKPVDSFNIPNYITYRTDRISYAGGGTAILVRNRIPHHSIHIETTLIENTIITIERRNSPPITTVSAYKSPSKDLSHMENFSGKRQIVSSYEIAIVNT
ncbi:putative RNA-directed DNA polymerase from transposon X-element [Nephila pilipes]|uniref:Putative RNA-directed DNA polymerase from transposon X-element n=1 Tax=Nephila pilipes TaxID=299642 RepID=A0A8X6U4R4_NEPPI|nr:putative RNA-directed DNA polymerase from transposon X-element [Nephila pilipes]